MDTTLKTALMVLQQQRNQALNMVADLSGELASRDEEIVKLNSEIEELKKAKE